MTNAASSMFSNAIKLAAFAALCTALVAGVNLLTAPKIAAQLAAKTNAAIDEVLNPQLRAAYPERSCRMHSNASVFGSDKAQNFWLIRSGEQVGAVVYQVTAPDGYNGDIQFLLGLNTSNEITGLRVISHNETPGLGDKFETRRSDWVYAFNGLRYEGSGDTRWAVRKDGGQFDAFTGATITPRAIVNATRRVLAFHQQQFEPMLQTSDACEN